MMKNERISKEEFAKIETLASSQLTIIRAFLSGWECNYGIIWDLEEGVCGYSFITPEGSVYQTLDWNDIPLGMTEEVNETWKKHQKYKDMAN